MRAGEGSGSWRWSKVVKMQKSRLTSIEHTCILEWTMIQAKRQTRIDISIIDIVMKKY